MEHKSITKAAEVTGFSYKTAWDAVNAINNLLPRPAFVTRTGGPHGGGAEVTGEGRRLILAFRRLEEKLGQISAAIAEEGLDHEKDLLFLGIGLKLSVRNALFCTVVKIMPAPVNIEVKLEVSPGIIITAAVTNASVHELGLALARGDNNARRDFELDLDIYRCLHDFDNRAEERVADAEFQADAQKEQVFLVLQALFRDRRRNLSELFLETAESQNQAPSFAGHFGAAAMRAARAGDKGRARQQVIDRVDRVPGGLVAKPRDFRRLGDALVLHHGFKQSDAFASNQQPPAGPPRQQTIYLARQAPRQFVLPLSDRLLEFSPSAL